MGTVNQKAKKPALLLREGVTMLDGGMGTLLQARGLKPGEKPETWALIHPEEVTAIHRAYYEAGSRIVSANTFGASRFHYTPDELRKIIPAALDCVRRAREACGGGERYIALDIGPTGRLLEPYGPLPFEEAVAAFAETVRIGAEAGADCVLIETMNDSYETKAALLAVKENCDLPVLVSNAYGADGKLMTGATPEVMVAMLEGMGADAIGVNCSLGPAALRTVVERYLAAASVPVLMKPNAGLPRTENGQTVYDVDPESFAREMADLIPKGLRILGGCCGTTPAYIRALVRASEGLTPPPVHKKTDTVFSSWSRTVTFGDRPILIGERINPTGKKKLRQALAEERIDYVLSEGLAQQEAGVDALDVNVGAPGIPEAEMLPRVVRELQAVTELPLQLDTADPAAMEAAMRVYNGKPMINSVNGKRESMEILFPLMKKYGGVAVALTLDESGIPETAEGRLRIAERILITAEAFGIDRKDIVFDPLTLTVSADAAAAETTLEALRLIRQKTGCPAVLGVSNCSFGLPDRDRIGSAFFTLALASGLSGAIMNPLSAAMSGAYRSWMALTGRDAQCADYIRFSLQHPLSPAGPGNGTPATPGAAGEPEQETLRRAVRKGLREAAARLAGEQIAAGREPMALVKEEIIPALDDAGAGFEKKTLFLPQLMMCAEAAEAAFTRVKEALAGRETAEAHGPLVLATVRGDVHDIGKNIVRLLLENYGFQVTDLGKDTPPERIAETVRRLHAPVCGLSALMTTTVPAMEETIDLLRREAPWCRVMVGGAVLTGEYARSIGADGYAADAMSAVRVAERLEKESLEAEKRNGA